MDSFNRLFSKTQTTAINQAPFVLFWAASLLLVICMLLPASALANNSTASKPATTLEFGKFKVLPAGSADARTLDIQHNGKSILQLNESFQELTFDEVQKDIPLPGCETLKVNLNTGGTNNGYYLLSICKDKDFAAYVKPYDGGVMFDPELKTYTAYDPSFMDYQAKLANSDDGINLSRAESPRMTRILVFENGIWRADKPKEFADFYTTLQNTTEGDEAMPGAARSIAATYYAYMAGVPRMQASSLLKKLLPTEYTNMSDKIFSDIQKAIREFKIVQNLDLNAAK